MWIIYFILFGLVNAQAGYVTKKFCKDVDPGQCSVFSVAVDPCSQAPAYCNLKIGKKYAMTLNLTPKFSAESLKLAIYGDVKNDGSFSHVIQSAQSVCGYLTCPVRAEDRRIFDVDLMLDKTVSGKFPVKVKLWSEGNATQACCFTFVVKA